MNIPNLDFEISLIKGFWYSTSKIDWFRSLSGEGTISIIVLVVLLVAILVRYAEYEFKQMKLWQSIALVFSIPMFLPLYYYLMKLYLHLFLWMMEFPWYMSIFIIPLSAGFLIVVVVALYFRWSERKKSRKSTNRN
jgi:hypothetical protein